MAQEAYELIIRLPISPVIYEKIVTLEKVRSCSNPDWENILNTKSKYKLLYSLYVVSYLIEGNYNQVQESLIE